MQDEVCFSFWMQPIETQPKATKKPLVLSPCDSQCLCWSSFRRVLLEESMAQFYLPTTRIKRLKFIQSKSHPRHYVYMSAFFQAVPWDFLCYRNPWLLFAMRKMWTQEFGHPKLHLNGNPSTWTPTLAPEANHPWSYHNTRTCPLGRSKPRKKFRGCELGSVPTIGFHSWKCGKTVGNVTSSENKSRN